MLRTALIATVLATSAQAGHHSLPDCRETVEIYPGTTLARLADTFFGDVDYRYSILLSTNARVGQGFDYIGNPNALPVGKSLCIPEFSEAEVEKNRFLTYENAVRDMALPYPSEVSTTLDPIDITRPVTVSSWVRADQAPGWIAKIGTTGEIGRQTWVTEAPNLQQFCAQYVADRGPDPVSLTLRLEQRLGLAPQSAKTHFVEFEIANPGAPTQIFRPCTAPDVTTTTCAFGALPACAPGDTACHRHSDFFLGQYYHSFGVALPTEFPWTSLGYTFDWAHNPIGLSDRPSFIQYGESEYVVPATATVTVKSVTPTLDYCTAK